MRKPAKAAAPTHGGPAAGRLDRSGCRPDKSGARDPLFPVIIITGISDFNEINDLRVFITAVIPQTLHLVVGTPEPPPFWSACP